MAEGTSSLRPDQEPEYVKTLTKGQAEARKTILNTRDHIILDGEAGTGKDYLATNVADEIPMALTAMTGRAALNYGGVTLDSLLCLNRQHNRIWSYARQMENLQACPRVVAINEGSMMGPKIAQHALDAANAFGKQLLIIMDLAQAYPVDDVPMVHHPLFMNATKIRLTEVCRQRDAHYLAILSEMRRGELSPENRRLLMTRMGWAPDDVVRLYGTNAACANWNNQQMARLTGVVGTTKCRFTDNRESRKKELTPADIDAHIQDSRLAHDVRLKIGARVVCTVNHQAYRDTPLEELAYESPMPDIKIMNGQVGTLVDAVIKVDGKLMKLADFTGDTTWCEPPTIIGTTVDFDGVGRVNILSIDREQKQPNDDPDFTITGIPLRLGFGLTVHFSQGMTLEKCAVDMESIARHPDESRHGLAYVAFSRVKSPAGLTILSWNQRALYCSPLLKDYI